MTKNKSKNKELERIKKAYEEQLKRKDAIIEQLKKEKEILMEAMIKNSERVVDLQAYLNQLLKKKERISEKQQ